MTSAVRLQGEAASLPPRALWSLGAFAFINLLGLSFIWPITTIYIHEVLGRPVTVAGLVLTLYSAASFLGQLTGGALYDRIGGRPVITSGLLLAGAAIALPGLIPSWPLYVGAMGLFGFAQSLVFPALNALAAAIWPEGGRRTFNFVYVTHNAGVAVGTALGGVVASHSFRLAFLGAGTLSLTAATLAFILLRYVKPKDAAPTIRHRAAGAPARRIPWLPIAFLLFSHWSLWLVYTQWSSTLAVYMQSVGVPLPAYSLLWTLNGAVIVFGQPIISYAVRYVRSLPGQLFLGLALYLAAFGLLLTSSRYPVFVVAMVVLTFGEMLLWPGIPAAVDQLAPADRRGLLQGSVGGATAAGRMVGPLVGGLLYDNFGAATLLHALPILLLVPLLSLALYLRAAHREVTAAGG